MNNIVTEAKMGQITLVTPPDFVQNQNRSFCLINFSKRDKDSFASQLNLHMSQQEITLYLWDDNNFSVGDSMDKDDPNYDEYIKNWQHSQNNRDYNWLLNACNAATTVIINMEYISRPLLVWSGYILTLAKTYFINGNEKEAKIFNVLNRNRIESIPKMFERLYSNKDAR
jgi:hypothetical protein